MKAILDFFQPPVFPEDEEKTRSAYYLNAIALVSLPVILLFLFIRLFSGTEISSPSNLILIAIAIVLVVVFALGKAGYTKAGGYLHIITIWTASTLLAISGNGAKGTGAASYFVVIAMASLLLGYKPALQVAALSIISIFGLAYGETIGFITPGYESPFSIAVQNTVLVIFSSLFTYLSVKSLQKAIQTAQSQSHELEYKNKELRDLQQTLEARVKERTESLTKANIENKRRANQFQTVAQIAQKIASERNLETLLLVITEYISAQFNFHHVGIYLNDDIDEYTVLNAASSEEGRRMMERGHKVHIEPSTLIGYTAKTGNARMVSDTRIEEQRLGTPDLPDTLSEFAIPLKIDQQIVGVLDTHSKAPNAFDQTDIEALTALANQITIAIQNTRLYVETQTALAESQMLYGTVVKQTWKANVQDSAQIGYRYRGVKPVALEREVNTPEIRNALENGDLAVTHPSKRKSENALALPLKIRDATIGVLNVNLPVDMELGEDEIDILRAAAQRVAIALENASLLEESQRRARREQVISEMSTKISAGTEIETILKTTIRELGSQIGAAQIMVELGNEEE